MRDIHADGAAKGVIIEGNIACSVDGRDITIIIGCVTYIAAATIAGNILHYLRIGDIELIGVLYGYRCRVYFGRH